MPRLWRIHHQLFFFALLTLLKGQSRAQPPPGCSYRSADGSFSAEWQLQSANSVVFEIRARASTPNFWTGIGIGPHMKDADFHVVTVENGEVEFRDLHLSSSQYRPPDVDTINNLQDTQRRLEDGVITARFSRLLDTGDPNDKSLAGCVDLMFPESGGEMFFGNLGKHSQTPKRQRVCIQRDCGTAPRPSPSVQPPPGCSFAADGYKAEWLYSPQSRDVRFTVTHRAPPGNFWTGIGFGESMRGADIIIVSSINGIIETTDRNALGYIPPRQDSRASDVKSQGAYLRDGSLVAVFSRAVDTRDPDDKIIEDPQLTDGEPEGGCQYFMFPVYPGTADPAGIGKHSRTPIVKLVCGVTQCYPGGRGGRVGGERNAPQPTNTNVGSPQGPGPDPAVGVNSRPDLDATPQPSVVSGGEQEFSVPSVTCSTSHVDHPLCKPYFEEYFQNVTVWANENRQNPQEFFPKACFIISQHQTGLVRSICCKTYSQQCTPA